MKAYTFFLFTIVNFFQLLAVDSPLPSYYRLSLFYKNSGLETIDCIYAINLTERLEKWERMQKIFGESNCQITRFDAINGWKFSNETIKELFGCYTPRLSKGQVGCLLSHLSVIHSAYLNNLQIAWICEDDVEIVEDLNELPQLITELSILDPDWDVFYTDLDTKNRKGETVLSLGSDFRPDVQHKSVEEYVQRTLVSSRIIRINQRFGLYSYILSNKGMKKILDFYSENAMWTAIDIDIHYVPDIREYSSTKEIVTICHKSPFSDTTNKLE